MQNKSVWIYDLETYSNFFSYVGINVETEEVRKFYAHSSQNQIEDLLIHLQTEVKGQVGFNNLNFDYPIIHNLLNSAYLSAFCTGDEIAKHFYQLAQDIIACQNSEDREVKYKYWIWENDMIIPQLDLFKMYHYDNRAKRTSLKDLEISMGWRKVQDLPLHHTSTVTEEQIPLILEYNLNDVLATYEFFKKSADKISLRRELNKKYNLNLFNSNDTAIGSSIFAKFISEEKNIPLSELKKMRTWRKDIKLGECILPYVKYSSKPFNDILENLKGITIVETKGSLEYSVIYKGFKYDFGTGGIHGCIKPGVYKNTDTHVIMSCDVTSLYPNLAIQNEFFPQHLGKTFVKIYNDIFKTRAKAKKEGDKAVNEGLKLALNGVYGKSNDKYSFLYDPKFTMQITINGQLLLCMLAEKFQDAGFEMLMINTDGIECIVPKDKIEVYNNICKEWEKKTKLELEFTEYKKLVIRDVNNYIGIFTNDKVKYKGTFEIYKDYHKNSSFKVVPYALSEYFVKGIPVEMTIKNHPVILDFCGRFKATAGWWSELRYWDLDETRNPYVKKDKLQKTNRYYISTDGASYLKCNTDGRESFIERDWKVTIFNDVVEKHMEDYKIDYSYYIKECYKIISVIETKQLAIF